MTIDDLTIDEWAIVGIIMTKRICWPTIAKRFGSDLIPLLQKLADQGYDEYLIRYNQISKERE